jgi:hypothetical protein
VELGVLTIDKAVPNSAEVEKKLLFLPGQLTDGIEESDDPLTTSETAPTLFRSRGAIHDQSEWCVLSENHVSQNWCSDNAADTVDSSRQWRVLFYARCGPA